MLVKLSIPQLKAKLEEMTAIADKMEFLNGNRIKKIIEINTDRDHTSGWKATALAPLENSPELRALASQQKLLWDVIEEQRKIWQDSAGLLRAAVVPERPERMGVEAYGLAVAELNFLITEAAALSVNPEALQAAVDAAVLAENWRRLYALTLGRIDAQGLALTSTTSIGQVIGTPLSALPLPGRDESDEIFFQCKLAKLRCEAVILQLEARDILSGPGRGWELSSKTTLAIANRDRANDIQQRDRLRAAPTALERWEIYKDGIPALPDFQKRVDEALERVRAIGSELQ
jgi:hypothetical protein